MVGIMQLLDATFLILTVCCALVLLAEDPFYCTSRRQWRCIIRRAALVGLGIGSFSQAAWLLGVWVPGVAGYPWPRLTLDACMFFLFASRALYVLRLRPALKEVTE